MKYLKLGLFLLFSMNLSAQDTMQVISFKNPSFEEKVGSGLIGWTDCGEPNETPFDIHESGKGIFAVKEDAFDGRFFVGFVARDNGTTEGFGQKLSQPIRKGKTYSFSLVLRRPEQLLSHSRKTGMEVNYNKPAKLALYGGNSPCSKEELLAVTKLVGERQWTTYDFIFSPAQDYTYLTFKLMHLRNIDDYNGALLMDDLSNIVEVKDVDLAKKVTTIDMAELEWVKSFRDSISTGNYFINDTSFEYGNWVNCDKDDVRPDRWSIRDYIEDMPTNPYDGDKFFGLIAKWNHKTASITQKLHQPLKKGVTYELRAFLQRPQVFMHDGNNYTKKVKLGIYGGDDCETMALLALSPVVSNQEWKDYTFYLTPKNDCYYIQLKAVHNDRKRYNGGVLVDYLSDFVEVE